MFTKGILTRPNKEGKPYPTKYTKTVPNRILEKSGYENGGFPPVMEGPTKMR